MNSQTSEVVEERKGFTLVEVMVACALSLILAIMLITASVNYQRIFRTQNSINDVKQSVRAAMDLITRDLRSAGYGLDESASADMVNWVTWISGFNSNPMIADGGTGPDTVYIAGAYTEPIGHLMAPVAVGDRLLPLDSGGTLVNTSDKSIVFIGRLETARISGIAGNALTISTHSSSDVGIAYSYEAGAPVEMLSIITYQVMNTPAAFPYKPYLQRIDSTTTYIYDWLKMAAGNIEDLQITDNGRTLDIEVQGCSSEPDDRYTDPDVGDHYRRFRLESTIYKRN